MRQFKSLNEIRAAANQKNKIESTDSPNFIKFFPHWTADVGSSQTIRFLPDKNENNFDIFKPIFTHTLFIDGKPKVVTCAKTHNGPKAKCPICEAKDAYYKQDKESILGKQLVAKRDWVYQGFVLNSSLEHDDGTVYQFRMNNQLHKKITKEMGYPEFIWSKELKKLVEVPMDPDTVLRNNPAQYTGGHNFKIVKSLNSFQKADYGSSKFVPHQSDLTDEQILKAEEGIKDLTEFQPRDYSYDELQNLLLAHTTSLGMSSVPVLGTTSDDDYSDDEQVSSPVVQQTQPIQPAVQQSSSSAGMTLAEKAAQAKAKLQRQNSGQ